MKVIKLKTRLIEYRTAALYYIFRIFPIKNNKVIFCNYNGKGYGCNTKYIAEEMLKRGGWDLVWLVSNMTDKFPDNIRKVKYESARSIYEMATAEIWVDNQRKLWFNRKRKNQYFLHTWHGAGIPMKKIGADNQNNLNNKPYEHTSKHMNKIANLMITDSKACTPIFKRAFLYDGEILECGYPRNDILINTPMDLKDKVYDSLKIDKKCKTVIYAPTYRQGRKTDMYNLNFQILLNALTEKFGGSWKLLLRLHPTMRQKTDELIRDNNNIVNVSFYDDMSELMAVCDVMISDYSSVVSEFAMTEKPVFLYAEDINNYSIERDFYTDYYKLPFPIAVTNEELYQNILKYEENKYKSKVNAFLEKTGIIKTGSAAKVIVDRFEELISVKYLKNYLWRKER